MAGNKKQATKAPDTGAGTGVAEEPRAPSVGDGATLVNDALRDIMVFIDNRFTCTEQAHDGRLMGDVVAKNCYEQVIRELEVVRDYVVKLRK